jgi:predicted DNA-binding transcriptional regulator YafY
MNQDNTPLDFMQDWFERFMGRFDKLDKFMEIMSKRHNVLNGERLLDNQDLCQMLNVSKRTLQRYRSNHELEYITIHHKIFYTERNVEKFIKDHFKDGKVEELE